MLCRPWLGIWHFLPRPLAPWGGRGPYPYFGTLRTVGSAPPRFTSCLNVNLKESWGHMGDKKTWDDRRRKRDRTHVGATDPLQQEPGHFCLSVKLCLGHSELLLSLGRAGDEHEGKNGPQTPSH